jgi:magnesium-protoporphyrin O-methyltransferase
MAHDDDPTRSGKTTPVCGAGCACAVGNEFGERTARHDRDAYRKHGPDETTRWLIDGLRGGPDAAIDGLTVLDIGAGVGAVHLGLLEAGAGLAVDVDGSRAYVTVAIEEARRQGVDDRVRHVVGDFVELAPEIAEADLVALDRVVCCYPDMQELVARSIRRTRLRYGLVYPRDSGWIRIGARIFNAANRLLRQRVRMYIHATSELESILAAAGFRRTFLRTTRIWQVAVFERT